MRIFIAFLLAFAVGPCGLVPARAATPQETVQTALNSLAPGVRVDSVRESVLPGFYEASAGGRYVYVSKDGRHVLDGALYDVKARRDLTALARATARKQAIDRLGPDKRIIFAPADAARVRHTVTVFTDPDCPYCRRFHEQMAAYNAEGIAVEYLFLPLSIHPEASRKAQAVWCAADRRKAFDHAMAGEDPGSATCPNPVAEVSRVAASLGITGTPTILAADGSQIPNQAAASPQQLAAELARRESASAKR